MEFKQSKLSQITTHRFGVDSDDMTETELYDFVLVSENSITPLELVLLEQLAIMSKNFATYQSSIEDI